MKKAYIIYFGDQTAVVALATDPQSAMNQLDSDQLQNVSRIDTIPYPVL